MIAFILTSLTVYMINIYAKKYIHNPEIIEYNYRIYIILDFHFFYNIYLFSLRRIIIQKNICYV